MVRFRIVVVMLMFFVESRLQMPRTDRERKKNQHCINVLGSERHGPGCEYTMGVSINVNFKGISRVEK